MQREESERLKWLNELGRIPEDKRTPLQQRALSSPYIPTRYSESRFDEFGLEPHNHYFHPASALHQPFAGLLAASPKVGLSLITRITNHATRAWRQSQALRRKERGTPIPITLDFPWGRQQFWGDWHVFGWGLGILGPEIIQCAYLTLAHWAFKGIERGRSTSEIIQELLDGSECYASLGLCLRLAIETFEVSETTFPIVTCQRLWEHDLARVVHEPQKDIDLFGFGFLAKLTGAKADAKAYLDSREYRKHDVRQLAMRFALGSDLDLRQRFKRSLEAFPHDLPFEIEEERESPDRIRYQRDQAMRWCGLGNIENYRMYELEDDQVAVGYEPPKPPTESEEKKVARATKNLEQYSALQWAINSLNEGGPAKGWTLANAVAFAKANDEADMFGERADVGPHVLQSGISAIAACVICFDEVADPADREWAWQVMGRVLAMREPANNYGSKIPWHPAFHLIIALSHDRKRPSPRTDSASRLITLTSHSNEEVQVVAFQFLFMDPNGHVKWVAAHLALDYAHRIQSIRDEDSFEQDDTADREAREEALVRALRALGTPDDEGFRSLPPAWVQTTRRSRYGMPAGSWVPPDTIFDGYLAAKVFFRFPVEEWCASEILRPNFQALLVDLARWTAEMLMPPWHDGKSRLERRTDLYEWDRVFGTMLARAAPFFDLRWLREDLLRPFLAKNEEALRVLAAFAEGVVTRHVLDAKLIPANALPLLDDCVERVIDDRIFVRNGYRAGEVCGFDMPELIKALLFVSVGDAPGAARFANGDWSSIAVIVPLITKLVTAAGWSTFVMGHYLTLCERAGAVYPVDAFIEQASAALDGIENAKGGWAGTFLPARLAATIQRLAEANYPLEVGRARGLLKILDALIDLGDRRSAALEQDEAFRRVQGDAA